MTATDYQKYHPLVEKARMEKRGTIQQICTELGISYWGYSRWRYTHGAGAKSMTSADAPSSELVEIVAADVPESPSGNRQRIPMAGSVNIKFPNGLTLHRSEMSVDSLIQLLTAIRDTLCLD